MEGWREMKTIAVAISGMDSINKMRPYNVTSSPICRAYIQNDSWVAGQQIYYQVYNIQRCFTIKLLKKHAH